MRQLLRAIGLSTTTLALLTAALLTSSAAAADVAVLKQTLSTGAPADRHAAADQLADLGVGGRQALPELLEALRSTDADLRWRAARALGVIGDAQAVNGLHEAVADTETLVRAQAIFALGRLKATDEQSLAAVIQHLSDSDAQVRRAAVRALRMIEPQTQKIVPLVVKLLNDSEPANAARALSSIADGGVEVVPALIAALDPSNTAQKDARYWSCLALGEMGPQAQAAVPALINVLADDRPEVRLQAAIALGEIGPDSKPASGALIKLMDDPIPSVRAAAVFGLGQIGDPASSAALENAEKSEDHVVRMLATWALAKLHPSDQQRLNKAIDLLVQALGDKSREVAGVAAKALDDLRPGTDLLRPLIDRLMASKPEAAERIFSAVAPLGAGAVTHAMEGLKDPHRRVRAMQVLSRIGPESAQAVPTLTDLLKSGEAATVTEALYTVGAIGPLAQGAVPTIVEQLKSSDARVVQAAVIALGKIGPAAKEAIPALAKINQSDDELLRLTSVWAILKIGPLSESLTKVALPILSTALRDKREVVRMEAATTLGDLGQGAGDALAALEAASQDSSPAVRSAATAAIAKIKQR